MTATAKTHAREQMRKLRKNMVPAQVDDASRRIADRALALPEWSGIRRAGGYVATSREAQTAELLAALSARGIELAVPAWDAKTGRYGFARWAPDGALRRGPDGIDEPSAPEWIDRDALDAILIPCVAFDHALRRLGHGGGHYDRLLQGYRGLRIGLAFEAQRLDRIETESHDIPLDLVITEASTYRKPPC